MSNAATGASQSRRRDQSRSPVKPGRALPGQILKRQEVESLTRLSRSALYREMAEGNFPRPIRLTQRSVGWVLSEVTAWIESRERVAAQDLVET